MGISSGFSLTNHLALSGPESVFGLSQGSPVCVCVCVGVCVCISQPRWIPAKRLTGS